MSKDGKRTILRPVNGLRGLTAISVIIVHFSDSFVVLLPALEDFLLFSNRIAFRMDLFFMLSGFMAAYVHVPCGERFNFPAYKDFLVARLVRLYPSYLAALLLLLGGVWYLGWRGVPVSGMYHYEVLPSRLVLFHAWPYLRSWAWNYPTWFLSALWFAYLFIFPLAWVLVQKLRGSKAAYAWAFAPVALWLGLSQVPALGEFYAVLRVSCEFLAGAALFVLVQDGSRLIAFAQRYLDQIVFGFVALMLTVSLVSLAALPKYVNVVLVIATPLLLAGATAETSRTARLLATRPMQWLGRISYALFITHAVSQRAMNVFLPAVQFSGSTTLVRLAVFAAYWAAILVLALAVYQFVEVPCATALKKRWRRRSASGANGTATVSEASSATVAASSSGPSPA